MAFLEVKNIYKQFGQTEVLKGISFSLDYGKVISIIGSSGSGKTTLLRCLNFLETPNKGSILVDGKTIFDSEDPETKRESAIRESRLNFGLVFQSFHLFPQYTALKNLTLAPTLAGMGTPQEIEEEARALLQAVGLLEKANFYPCQLSGGQQQRVAIARALMMKPKILCFDEPTSALDPELTGEVLKVIKELRDQGRTMIVVTHEMDFARRVSDEIIFMADGVIAEQGAPETLFTAPKTTALQHFLAQSNL